MNPLLSRRRFLSGLAATCAAGTFVRAAYAGGPRAFSFVLLGDLHLDQLEHHDMAWVQAEKPNDVAQIQNYSRITREVTPALFARVRQVIAAANQGAGPRVAFVLQVGDLVEGLCGSEQLALRHNRDAVDFVANAGLGVPFLFTKGNHDITGPGAGPAFNAVFPPFLTDQVRRLVPGAAAVQNARYTAEVGNTQFAFFDAYEASASLEWLEAVAAKRTAEHFFVVVHPPVVPYGARATWHVFASERDRARREKLLALLGDQRALVLGGHIHRYSTLARRAGKGAFAQLAISSVLSSPAPRVKEALSGLDAYTPDQVTVEPKFSPANEAERRAVYVAERPFVSAFEYADLPGYAVVTVDGPKVTATTYAGTGQEIWRAADLTQLARAV